jgi:hypothetical protein
MLSAFPPETAEGTGQSGLWCTAQTVHVKSPRTYFVAINTMCSHVTSILFMETDVSYEILYTLLSQDCLLEKISLHTAVTGFPHAENSIAVCKK